MSVAFTSSKIISSTIISSTPISSKVCFVESSFDRKFISSKIISLTITSSTITSSTIISSKVHFIESSFCRKFILSKVHFVESSFRRKLFRRLMYRTNDKWGDDSDDNNIDIEYFSIDNNYCFLVECVEVGIVQKILSRLLVGQNFF